MDLGNDKSGHQRTACRVVCFNGEKIAALRASVPAEQALAVVAARHKALGHPSRLSIMAVLAADECCVCDLASVLQMPLSTLSQHLKTLRRAGLVRSRQEGKLVFYSLDDAALESVENAVPLGGVA